MNSVVSLLYLPIFILSARIVDANALLGDLQRPKFIDNLFFRNLLEFTVANIQLKSSTLFNHPLQHSVSNRFSDQYYILYDVLDLNTQIRHNIHYTVQLLIAPSGCDAAEARTRNTLAECGLGDGQIWKVTSQIRYDPLLDSENKFTIEEMQATPYDDENFKLPEHLQLLGFELPKNADLLFKGFKQQHGKLYSAEEDSKRFKIFKKNLLKIQLIQVLDRGTARYGITPFADLTDEEFKRTHANLMRPFTKAYHPRAVINVTKLPTSFDWRSRGAVTEVKDQQMCGSCWAFAVTGNIEGQWFKKTGNLVSLSEQQLLDCDEKDEACNGGYPEYAYESIVKMGGLMSEADYPYDAEKETCHLKLNNISAYINDSLVLSKNETELAAWLTENGPISVGMNANFLQFYFWGVSHPPHMLCSETGLNHAVLLVGYGVTSFWKRPYWIVKNSWSKHWGENGYFRIYRGDGTCGINADATSSIIR